MELEIQKWVRKTKLHMPNIIKPFIIVFFSSVSTFLYHCYYANYLYQM